MNVVELSDRCSFLLNKYEKFMPDTTSSKEKAKGKGAFEQCYVDLLDEINTLTLKAEETGNELNRAVKAALNAELRRAKATLLETGLPKLEKLIQRGKGLTKEVIDDRAQKVQQVREGIASIADGVSGTRKPRQPLLPLGGKVKGKQHINLSGELDPRQQSPGYYKQTEVATQFRKEWDVAKARQDHALDNIEKGLGVLKGIGEAMGENLSQQDVLLTEIDSKMDLANKGLRTNNMKLKGLVTQLRTSRNFCIDVALICVLLAMGLWIYNLFET